MNTDKTEVVEVIKPKITGANAVRSAGLIFGLATLILGVIMSLTIILIIPGIFGILIGIVVMALNLPKAIVDCPACRYDNKLAPPTISIACERCKTNIPVKWIDDVNQSAWTRSIFAKRK